MNATTAGQVKKILENGYYRMSQTLGDGGWAKIPNWEGHYNLFIEGEKVETIKAESDTRAINAFTALYNISNMGFEAWEIIKSVTVTKSIAGNID
jgi:hypothetical protein